MSLSQCLFNALKQKPTRRHYLRNIISGLKRDVVNSFGAYVGNNFCWPFKDWESIVFCSHVCRVFCEFEGSSEPGYVFAPYPEGYSYRLCGTWDGLVEALVGKLASKGYANVKRGFGHIVLAMMCLSYYDDQSLRENVEAEILDALIFLLELALESITSEPEQNGAEAEEPQPEADAEEFGERSGEHHPDAVDPVTRTNAGRSGTRRHLAGVPMDTDTVRGVKRHRLQKKPYESEMARYKSARRRYNLRNTEARQERLVDMEQDLKRERNAGRGQSRKRSRL